jgi:exopolysaccharide biosynthesis polyprenyl glycosylphosphotransferase
MKTAEGQRRRTVLGVTLGREPQLFRWLRLRGFRWLEVADAIALFSSMAGINLVRFGLHWPTYPLADYAVGFAAATTLHLVIYYFAGLYEREHRLGERPWLPQVAAATVVAVLLDALAELLTGRYLLPRFNLAALAVVASILVSVNRGVARRMRIAIGWRPRVFLVGNPDDIDLARSHLLESDWTAAIVGHMPSTDMLKDPLGPQDAFADLVYSTSATDVLLLSSGTLNCIFPEPLTSLEERGIAILQRIGAQETMVGLREVREVAGMPFVPLRAHTLPRSRVHLKRYIELVALLVTLPVVLLVAGGVALYIRAAAGRPIFLWQERVGRNGQVFRMLKFRTMRPDAEEGIGPVIARRDDPRVVRACRWIRDTRLDELPNLWNVLRGEMSIVGPRPERPELTALHEALIPGYGRRHEIPPGITGLAQIHGSYHTDPSFKLGYDLQYLVNWSPVLDLQIALRTIWVVLTRRV